METTTAQPGRIGGIHLRNELFIRRPPAEVFAYLLHFENMPKWNYYVVSVTQTTPGPIALGTTFHQVRKSDEQSYSIVELDPPRALAIKTLPPAQRLTMRFSLDSVEGGTRLIDEWHVQAGWTTPFLLLARSRIRDAVATNLEVLRQLLEVGSARLPDGRMSTR
jgi:hypothetical protein